MLTKTIQQPEYQTINEVTKAQMALLPPRQVPGPGTYISKDPWAQGAETETYGFGRSHSSA